MSQISVVIPTYNARQLLEKHLPHVAKILDQGDEIVVVDDASTDGTAVWVEQQHHLYQKKGISLHLVKLEKNQRFAAAVNAGVAAAEHPYVLLLNNDVSPLSKDLKPKLLAWFSDSKLFAVGCAEVREATEKTKVFGRGTGGWQRGLLVHWYDPDQDHTDTLWTSGGSMMFDRSKFNTLGGMDTLFYPAYEEDRDLSYRALKHGWKLAFDFHARVLHQHETTNKSVFGSNEMEIVSWKNQYLLVWKNITDTTLLINHFLWLPYHLTVSGLRSQGAAVLGFWRALGQLSSALTQRGKVQALWKKSDQEVLTN